jgi:hypothetical protein
MKRTIGLLAMALIVLAFTSPARPQTTQQGVWVGGAPSHTLQQSITTVTLESKTPETERKTVRENFMKAQRAFRDLAINAPEAEKKAVLENFLKAKEVFQKAYPSEFIKSADADQQTQWKILKAKQPSEAVVLLENVSSSQSYNYTPAAAGPKDSQAELLRRWKETKDEAERGKIKDELNKILATEFQDHLGQQEKEIAALEAKVQKLRGQLEVRRSKQEEIIDFRVQQLLRDAEGLGWGANINAEPVSPSTNRYGGPARMGPPLNPSSAFPAAGGAPQPGMGVK